MKQKILSTLVGHILPGLDASSSKFLCYFGFIVLFGTNALADPHDELKKLSPINPESIKAKNEWRQESAVEVSRIQAFLGFKDESLADEVSSIKSLLAGKPLLNGKLSDVDQVALKMLVARNIIDKREIATWAVYLLEYDFETATEVWRTLALALDGDMRNTAFVEPTVAENANGIVWRKTTHEGFLVRCINLRSGKEFGGIRAFLEWTKNSDRSKDR